MNLQALYDLKERLEHSAIAGTGLLQEDFRLKRAVENLAPLAAASPVFAKISTSVNKLLEASAEERSKQLLDVLSLVDAVVYTQGSTGVAGEITSIGNDKNTIGKYVHASYLQFQPLIVALTTTGSGRMAVIQDCKENHPEFFEDFRVLPHVVNALGDSYSEIPDLIYEILRKQGKAIIPHLKEGFDPKGKKDMVRRAMLIKELAGADENDWYINILPETQKEIREIIIKALGEDVNNEKLILDLYNTEKGKAKEAVLYSLAKINSQESVVYWKKELEKNSNMAHCLEGVDSEIAADMASYGMRKFLEELSSDKKIKYTPILQSQLISYQGALVGKYSAQVYDLWLWIAEQMSKFDKMIFGDVSYLNCSVADILQITMIKTILWNPCKEVFELANHISEKYPEYFMNCHLLTDLIEQTPETVYDKYSHYLLKDKSDEINAAYHKQLLQVLNLIYWDEKLKGYYLEIRSNSDSIYYKIVSQIKISGFDKRWVELLTEVKGVNQSNIFCANTGYRISSPMDSVLQKIINTEDEELCKIIGKHLYNRILHTGNIHEYIGCLMMCGWNEWKGLLTHCVRKRGRLDFYYIRKIVNISNMSNSEKVSELKELLSYLEEIKETKKEKITYNKWEIENLKRIIDLLDATDEKILI